MKKIGKKKEELEHINTRANQISLVRSKTFIQNEQKNILFSQKLSVKHNSD